ncbi:MAG: shikimate kinase [Veillonellales bacterium]
MKNVVLIGFMGTGKTSVGRLLAARLHRPFIDTDSKIEQESGITVSEMFKQYGEAYFREQEKAVIAKVSRYTNTVIATGGGVVTSAGNMTRLKRNGIIIALQASLEVILERTERCNVRPLLDCPDRRRTVAALLRAREPLYGIADFTVDTSSLSPQQITDDIMNFFRQGGYLRGRI